LTDFLSGTQAVVFSVLGSNNERYRFLQTELVRWGYLQLLRSDKGLPFGQASTFLGNVQERRYHTTRQQVREPQRPPVTPS